VLTLDTGTGGACYFAAISGWKRESPLSGARLHESSTAGVAQGVALVSQYGGSSRSRPRWARAIPSGLRHLMQTFPVVRLLFLFGLLALTACSSDTTAPSGSTTDVSIQDFYFYPFEVDVRIGASVQWTNYDPVAHTTTSDAGLWDSGPIAPAAVRSGSGGSFRFRFAQRGTYWYNCAIHPPNLYPGFVGVVVVRP